MELHIRIFLHIFYTRTHSTRSTQKECAESSRSSPSKPPTKKGAPSGDVSEGSQSDFISMLLTAVKEDTRQCSTQAGLQAGGGVEADKQTEGEEREGPASSSAADKGKGKEVEVTGGTGDHQQHPIVTGQCSQSGFFGSVLGSKEGSPSTQSKEMMQTLPSKRMRDEQDREEYSSSYDRVGTQVGGRRRSEPKRFCPPNYTTSDKKKRPKLSHENECFNCGEGGDLIECSVCPKVYHITEDCAALPGGEGIVITINTKIWTRIGCIMKPNTKKM